jgi:BirA family biotin operon repressor/biotin-[acetyl-CoA-carboxylase] ligase
VGFSLSIILFWNAMLAIDIRHHLMPFSRQYVGDIDVYARLPSTQQFLVARPRACALWQIVVAEHQTSGVGRQARVWIASEGQVSFSARGWVVSQVSSIGLLSLLASLCVRDVLTSYGLAQVRLKWPNDVYVDQKKISGILISLIATSKNKFDIVLGIGLNRQRLPEQAGNGLLRITSLSDVLSQPPQVSHLIADILNAWFVRLPLMMSEQGRAELISEWLSYALWLNQSVTVQLHDRQIEGIFQGLTLEGKLKLKTPFGEQIFSAGDVQLRPLTQFS